nr:ISAs1 family transposase [Loktanella fryxellensis]
MSPIAHRAGGKVTWLKSQWKLSAYPAHFCVEIYTINAGGGDWCLALKGNQESLLSDARGCFSNLKDGHPVASSVDTAHGRKETRTGVVVSAKALGEYHEFPGLKGFAKIDATRDTGGKVTSQTRYFALSWMPTPEVLLATVRDHWAIENALHWQLDVSFREDAARNRKDNGPGNIAVLLSTARSGCRPTRHIQRLSQHQTQASWLGRGILM